MDGGSKTRDKKNQNGVDVVAIIRLRCTRTFNSCGQSSSAAGHMVYAHVVRCAHTHLAASQTHNYTQVHSKKIPHSFSVRPTHTYTQTHFPSSIQEQVQYT